MHEEPAAELDARLGAPRAGFWLGWLSIAAVIAGLALGCARATRRRSWR
jgi:hypothetical protein